MTETEKQCATCFESANDCTPFQCGHVMHPACVLEHLSKLECPLCRASLETSLSDEVKRHITTRYQEVRQQETDEELANIVDEIVRAETELLSRLIGIPEPAQQMFQFFEVPTNRSPFFAIPPFHRTRLQLSIPLISIGTPIATDFLLLPRPSGSTDEPALPFIGLNSAGSVVNTNRYMDNDLFESVFVAARAAWFDEDV